MELEKNTTFKHALLFCFHCEMVAMSTIFYMSVIKKPLLNGFSNISVE